MAGSGTVVEFKRGWAMETANVRQRANGDTNVIVMKRNEVPIQVITRMSLENTTVCERSQAQSRVLYPIYVKYLE